MRAYDAAFSKWISTEPNEEHVDSLMEDRRAGGADDPKANMYVDKYHRFLQQLSKPELVDLLLESLHDIDFDRLVEAINGVLIARHSLRHPELYR